ncbi:cytochrome c maturation protein CcmC [Capsicum chacoense]
MPLSLLQPSFLMSKTRSYAQILIGSRLFLTAMAIHLSLRVAPLDLQQGGNSRIPYVHVPAARMSILVYIVMAINTFLFLLTKHPLFLRSSGTDTEIGAFSTLFTLVTGGFRRKPMWGTFWVWDARLTSVFILFLIYLGALRFQKLSVEPAPISIRAGPIDIPIIKSSVNWWNTLNQPGSISRSGTSIHVPMPIPILSNFANSPFSTRILFVLETRLPIPSFLESPLTEEIEAREGIPKPISLAKSFCIHVFTDKSIRLLGKNQYTSNVESGSTRTEIKRWVELFFGVKVIAKNSHRLPGKSRRMGPIMGHTMHYRDMIITLQPGYSIPPQRKKRTTIKILNSMAIHLYKTSTPSTRNGTVDSQVKSNPRNNLIYGQHRCGKGRNTRGIITARHRGGGHKRLYRKINFRRNEKDIYGRIVTIEYDPNRNAYICLIHYGDGEKRYILHPRGAIIGDTIVFGTEVPIKMGNALPLSAV